MKSPGLGAVSMGGFIGLRFGILPETELGTLGCKGGSRDVTRSDEGAGVEPDIGLINGSGCASAGIGKLEGRPT